MIPARGACAEKQMSFRCLSRRRLSVVFRRFHKSVEFQAARVLVKLDRIRFPRLAMVPSIDYSLARLFVCDQTVFWHLHLAIRARLLGRGSTSLEINKKGREVRLDPAAAIHFQRNRFFHFDIAES